MRRPKADQVSGAAADRADKADLEESFHAVSPFLGPAAASIETLPRRTGGVTGRQRRRLTADSTACNVLGGLTFRRDGVKS